MRTAICGLLLAIGAFSAQTFADEADPCSNFTWDVTRELAVMRQTPLPTVAGMKQESAPLIATEKLYDLSLSSQNDVVFSIPPGKPMLADGAQAGIVKFHTSQAGNYRVSITSGHWIDIVDGTEIIKSRDFQGQRGCERPHKIVEFNLPADHDLILQLSGATIAHVLVSITAAP